MNTGYITIEKFRIIEMCDKYLKQVSLKHGNFFSELINYNKKQRIIKQITMLKDCAETFGTKSDIVISFELFYEIIKVIGN